MLLIVLYGCTVGLPLGLTGGGGSIFAVPLLVYGLGLDFRRAVSITLAVVGITALYGAILQSRRGAVRWKTGLILGFGGVSTVPLGAWFGSMFPAKVALLSFAALMTYIGVQMIRERQVAYDMQFSWLSCARDEKGEVQWSFPCFAKLFAAGGITGILSGIFGVGGGFLIVPTLLFITTMSIEYAMATSLVAICVTATAGFLSHLPQLQPEDFTLTLWFLLGSVIGMTVGSLVKRYLSAQTLKRIFGYTVLGTAAYIVFKNV